MKILEALEIKVKPTNSDDEEIMKLTDFTYELVEYDGDNMWLQFEFKDPEQVSRSLTEPYTLQITFFGTEHFKNIFDKEVPFGFELDYPIVRQINVDDAKTVDTATSVAQIALVAVLVIFFFLIMCGGPLLPTWMFLNSMQLIFHVPLIKSDMPAHTHFFMIEYLNVLRLHFDWTESASESVLGSADKDDYDAMSSS